jgi:hypothetical protein
MPRWRRGCALEEVLEDQRLDGARQREHIAHLEAALAARARAEPPCALGPAINPPAATEPAMAAAPHRARSRRALLKPGGAEVVAGAVRVPAPVRRCAAAAVNRREPVPELVLSYATSANVRYWSGRRRGDEKRERHRAGEAPARVGDYPQRMVVSPEK